MTAEMYWNSSPDEIDDYIQSYSRRQEKKKKEEVAGWIHQADLIGESNPMAKRDRRTMPWDIFPELFAEEKKAYEQREFDNAMSKRRQAMAAWNERNH